MLAIMKPFEGESAKISAQLRDQDTKIRELTQYRNLAIDAIRIAEDLQEPASLRLLQLRAQHVLDYGRQLTTLSQQQAIMSKAIEGTQPGSLQRKLLQHVCAGLQDCEDKATALLREVMQGREREELQEEEIIRLQFDIAQRCGQVGKFDVDQVVTGIIKNQKILGSHVQDAEQDVGHAEHDAEADVDEGEDDYSPRYASQIGTYDLDNDDTEAEMLDGPKSAATQGTVIVHQAYGTEHVDDVEDEGDYSPHQASASLLPVQDPEARLDGAMSAFALPVPQVPLSPGRPDDEEPACYNFTPTMPAGGVRYALPNPSIQQLQRQQFLQYQQRQYMQHQIQIQQQQQQQQYQQQQYQQQQNIQRQIQQHQQQLQNQQQQHWSSAHAQAYAQAQAQLHGWQAVVPQAVPQVISQASNGWQVAPVAPLAPLVPQASNDWQAPSQVAVAPFPYAAVPGPTAFVPGINSGPLPPANNLFLPSSTTGPGLGPAQQPFGAAAEAEAIASGSRGGGDAGQDEGQVDPEYVRCF